MHKNTQILIVSLIVWTFEGGFVSAQGNAVQERGAEAFASENAILDTAIPFAIGAREAKQALRGSFGWPSFQEGLVEGVYFRFDPDGYARFAPTPRLDVDVFEVICRPRTHACAARKDGLEVFLTDRRQLQIRLEEALAGDMFFVSEGVSEIQVPERILQPLDVQLELLLGAGGDLVTRRGGSEVARTSLKGFSAVTAYLRWIAARQDYAVLPRGWPVPNAAAATSVTQPASWNSPMPQPQVIAPGYGTGLTHGVAPATSAAPLTAPTQALISPDNAGMRGVTGSGQFELPQTPSLLNGGAIERMMNVEVLRQELDALKALIADQQLGADSGPLTTQDLRMREGMRPGSPHDGERVQKSEDITRLLVALEALQSQVAGLQATRVEVPLTSQVEREFLAAPVNTAAFPTEQRLYGETGHAQLPNDASRLAFLVKNLGYDAQTALSILQAAPQVVQDEGEDVSFEFEPIVAPGTSPQSVLYENALVDQILSEMEAEMAAAVVHVESPPDMSVSLPNVAEYQLLSRYFVSAGMPVLLDALSDQSDDPRKR